MRKTFLAIGLLLAIMVAGWRIAFAAPQPVSAAGTDNQMLTAMYPGLKMGDEVTFYLNVTHNGSPEAVTGVLRSFDGNQFYATFHQDLSDKSVLDREEWIPRTSVLFVERETIHQPAPSKQP